MKSERAKKATVICQNTLTWTFLFSNKSDETTLLSFGQTKRNFNQKTGKRYVSSLRIKIPNVPGKLGEVSSLIGFHENNIINMEIIGKNIDYLEFIFDIQIRDLKNYRNLITELKLKEYKLKIIRHRKKDAFLQRIFKNFKRN